MPRDLFGDVTRPSVTIGSRKWYTVPVSLLSHAAIVVALVLIPLMAPAVLPGVSPGIISVVFAAPAPPPPPAPRIHRDVPVPANPDAAPVIAPSTITKEPAIEPGFESDRGVDGGTGIIVGGIDRVLPEAAPPRPQAPQAPVRVGGNIRAPQKVRDAAPVYPPIAVAARVQGLVIIEATIGADGRVADARVLRSVPLLDEAALTAVRQWQYTPTLLNGVPVAVVMTVTVAFQLR